MKCRFCTVRHAKHGSDICAYCDSTYSTEIKEALYALTAHQVTGTAQETEA